MEPTFDVLACAPDDLVLDENVRTKAKPPKWLVESIRAQGVLVPVIAHRDMLGKLVVTDGQLRVLAARQVLCETVPVFLGPPPGSAEGRIIEQLTVNEARVKMASSDVAQAVQQLHLFGMESSSIARKIGRSETDVKDFLRLAKAGPPPVETDDVPMLTIAQSAELAELLASPFCTPRWKEYVKNSFAEDEVSPALVLSRLRDGVDTERCLREAEEHFKEQGRPTVRRFDVDGFARLDSLKNPDGKKLTVENHKDCPGDVVSIWVAFNDGKKHVDSDPGCINYRAHGHLQLWETRQMSEAEKRRREKEEEQEAQAKARRQEFDAMWRQLSKQRFEFACTLLRTHRAGMMEDLVDLAFLSDEEWLFGYPGELLESAGLIPARVSAKGWVSSSAKAAKTTMFAAVLDGVLDFLSFMPEDSSAAHIHKILRRFECWGYELSPVELDFLAEQEKKREEKQRLDEDSGA